MMQSLAPPIWRTQTSPRVNPCQIQNPQALGVSPLPPPTLLLTLSRQIALQPQVNPHIVNIMFMIEASHVHG